MSKIIAPEKTKNYPGARNACKVCTPLGAALAFKGVSGAVPFFHGSQGCSTYVRRYLISHFKEPVDIASSNFSEHTTVFGGRDNLKTGLLNVIRQYRPKLVGIATTCLSETIGDSVLTYLEEFQKEHGTGTPLIPVSTPSYKGTHVNGYHQAVFQLVRYLAQKPEDSVKKRQVNVFPAILSPADLRHLKEIFREFRIPLMLLPDYSETLDGESWENYQKIAPGGTTVSQIKTASKAMASIHLGQTLEEDRAGAYLEKKFQVKNHELPLPIGIGNCDALFDLLKKLGGKRSPFFEKERGRLIDSYADGHKYVFGKRAIIYGEEDLAIGMASFLSEIGMVPVLCASGGESGKMEERLYQMAPELKGRVTVREGVDFTEIEEEAKSLSPDLILGNSKGYGMSRRMKIPLIRMGFPIHDRLGGQRILHIGYRGTQEFFDKIVNALLEVKQEKSSVGYSYL